jgi:cytochrome c
MRLMVLLTAGAMLCLPFLPAHAQDAERGAQAVRKCQACHNFGEGEGSKIGPPLFGVVGRQPGAFPGYAYSEAMRETGAAGQPWTPEMLASFLADPRDFLPGTKMAFAGIRSEEERADIVAYLLSISPD